MFTALFPVTPRDFPFRRAVRAVLRTLHILTTGVLLGGLVFDQGSELLRGWLWGSLASGALLFGTDLHASFAALLEVRGLLVVFKLSLVALAFSWGPPVPLLVLALVVGGVGSHMPGRLRHRLVVLQQRVAVDERNG